VTTEEETEEESIFRKSSSNDEYINDDDDAVRGQASPYDWISNLVPFGHPSARHILSVVDAKKRRYRRFIESKKKSVQNDDATYRLLNVTETIYYATLNHTNPRLVQLFKHDFVQVPLLFNSPSSSLMLRKNTLMCLSSVRPFCPV
jgi:hypothetical protein